MNDIEKAVNAVGDRLESLGDAVDSAVGDTADVIREEAREQSALTWLLWAALALTVGWAVWEELWRAAFVAGITLVLTMLPLVIQRWADFRLPRALIFLITLFAVCTLVLGEVFDFYETYWWWDVALHSGSAVMFGLFGIILIMLIFDNASITASPLMVAFLAFCFAMAVGAVWEIFEFAMDQLFGLNMQKSGLIDTMWDLIVDALGGIVGASAGWVYLKFGKRGMMSGLIHETVETNTDKFHEGEAESLPA